MFCVHGSLQPLCQGVDMFGLVLKNSWNVFWFSDVLVGSVCTLNHLLFPFFGGWEVSEVAPQILFKDADILIS